MAYIDFEGLILAIARDRDRSAFADLFRYFAPRLKSYALRGGCDANEAEEVAQETMIAVWRRAETFDPSRASASTWIFTIGRNKRIDMVRRQNYPIAESSEEEAMTVPDPAPLAADTIERHQMEKQVLIGIETLPEAQAEAIRMAFLEDKPHRKISEELSVPLGTVKSRIRLGLESLRGHMAGGAG